MSGYPWDDWSEEQKAAMRKVITHADLAKNYRQAGTLAKDGAAAAARAIADRGGLSPDEATTLARFRMHEETTGGDPNWQGPLNINAGPREPADTPYDVERRRDALFAATGADRKRVVDENRMAVERSREGFYDDLVQSKKLSQAEILTQSMKRKRKGG